MACCRIPACPCHTNTSQGLYGDRGCPPGYRPSNPAVTAPPPGQGGAQDWTAVERVPARSSPLERRLHHPMVAHGDDLRTAYVLAAPPASSAKADPMPCSASAVACSFCAPILASCLAARHWR